MKNLGLLYGVDCIPKSFPFVKRKFSVCSHVYNKLNLLSFLELLAKRRLILKGWTKESALIIPIIRILIELAAFSNFISPMAEYRQLSFISIYYISYTLETAVTRLFGGRLAGCSGKRKNVLMWLKCNNCVLIFRFQLMQEYLLDLNQNLAKIS